MKRLRTDSTDARKPQAKERTERPGKADQSAPRLPSLRESQKIMTRERILAAALEVFERVGFRQATIDQIAQAAEVNRATLYLHYSDKFDIAKGLAIRAIAVMSKQFERLNAPLESLAEVRQLFKDIFAVHRRHQTLFAVNHIAMFNNEPLLKMHRQIARSTFARLMEGRTPEQARQLRNRLMLLYYMYDRAFCLYSSIEAPEALNSDELVDTVADLWWACVLSPEPAGLVRADGKGRSPGTAKRGGAKSSNGGSARRSTRG